MWWTTRMTTDGAESIEVMTWCQQKATTFWGLVCDHGHCGWQKMANVLAISPQLVLVLERPSGQGVHGTLQFSVDMVKWCVGGVESTHTQTNTHNDCRKKTLNMVVTQYCGGSGIVCTTHARWWSLTLSLTGRRRQQQWYWFRNSIVDVCIFTVLAATMSCFWWMLKHWNADPKTLPSDCHCFMN